MKKSIVILGLVLFATDAWAPPSSSAIVASKAYVDNGLEAKQAKLPAVNGDVAVTYPTEDGGTPGQRVINTSVGSNTSDTGLVTAGAVVTALGTKQNVITGGTNGSVVVYNSSGGISGGSKGVYATGGTWNTDKTKLAEAQHVNAAIKNGVNQHLSCAGYKDPPNNTICWLYQMNTLDSNAVVMP